MSDLIYRHEAIRDIRLMDVCVIYDDMCSTEEAVEKAIVATKRNAIFGLECMNSAEPKIIRCKDCKYYYNTNPENIPTANIICFQMHEDDYCSYAERRTDEQTD